MKKRLAPLILAVPLLLSGCASAADDTSSEPSATSTEMTSATTPPPAPLSLDDTAELKDTQGNTLATISDIELSTEGCEDQPSGTQFKLIATLESNIDATELLWNSEFRFEDEDGMTYENTDLAGDWPCTHDGEREFNNVAVGEKRRAAITLTAPPGAQTMTYYPDMTVPAANPITWDIEDAVAGMTATPVISEEAPAPVENPAPASPETPMPTQQQSESIWTDPWEGYNCPQTDAWVIDASYCTPENLGAVPAQDLSTIPFADGGTCAAAICGYGTNDQGQRNPTSGEIQSLHGCQQGYITDPQLCEAVAWVETHQY